MLFCLWAGVLLRAQGGESQAGKIEALKYMNVQPEIKLSVRQTNMLVSSPTELSLKVTNLSDIQLTITKVEVDFPEMKIGRNENGAARPLIAPETVVNPGNSVISRMEFGSARTYWYFPFISPSLLFFRPGEYEARVVITYRYLDRPETMIEEKALVRLDPPLSAIIWGSVIGSFLLSLFITLYNLMKTDYPRNKIWIRFFYVSINGIVSGIILVLLIYRMKNLGLPIEISVTDFIGGIVLGLFTFKLGDWIYTKLVDNKALMYDAAGDFGRAKGGEEK
jgi:hypothetical protein